jgi:lipoprotein-releasing system ATP-binding protein
MSKNTMDSYQGGRQHLFRRYKNFSHTQHADIQDAPKALESKNNPSELTLEINRVSKDYKQGSCTLTILKKINLLVNPGEIIGIVGASGSGKSTLLHIAGLLDKKFTGNVLIGGRNTKEMDDDTLDNLRLKYLGFVYQYHHLLSDFTARENVAIPLIISGESKKQAMQIADSLLTRLGLGKRLENYPGELSGGEQQRVAVARSLINNPSIILADEPTGNLDNESAEIVMNLFLEHAR